VLNGTIGCDIEVLVKHENMQPTGAFKVRNALSAMTALSTEQKSRGVVAATRGNHGLGLCYAGKLLNVPVTICVPKGNSPAKNRAMQALGAELVEEGADYDESVQVATELQRAGKTMVHSTNDRQVLAGAATIGMELLEQDWEIDAIIAAVGGGSQAVGALLAASTADRSLPVYAVQAAGASAAHDGYRAGRPVQLAEAHTFADGLATRSCYEMTFEVLCEGLEDFITLSEEEIADAVVTYLRDAQTLAEGAGAASLAGLIKLRERLAGKRVAVILSGGNIDIETLKGVLERA
jgi:threonine dehydratase